MPIFLCRWPNGEFSIVSAADQEHAIIQLDEWGDAEQAQLWPMESCMVDFRLNDVGEIELTDSGLGQDMRNEVMERCYPELDEVLGSEAPDVIRAAVERERTRLANGERIDAETAIGRDVQQITGAPSTLVNRWVKKVAEDILKSPGDEPSKPN